MDFKYGTPPDAWAGKNFNTLHPNSMALSMSEGVTIPGAKGKFASLAAATVLGFRPGATAKWAPACFTWATCSVVKTVPTPKHTVGQCMLIS